jgi:uncharacterized protein (TIGR00730 family)
LHGESSFEAGKEVITRKNKSAYLTRRNVTVFCGSKTGNDPSYTASATLLGKVLAEKGFDIIYGGGGKGMMGALANSALSAGASVTGILPQVLVDWESQHPSLTHVIITTDMHERKKLLYEKGMAGIVLPGGFGTLDEMFEMLTWNQLSIHNKKIYILNTTGFYDHLIAHMEHLIEKNFLYEPLWNRISSFNDPESLVAELQIDLAYA